MNKNNDFDHKTNKDRLINLTINQTKVYDIGSINYNKYRSSGQKSNRTSKEVYESSFEPNSIYNSANKRNYGVSEQNFKRRNSDSKQEMIRNSLKRLDE